MFETSGGREPIAFSDLSRDEVAALITVLDWVEDILDGLPEKTAVRSALAKADLLAPMRRLAGRGFVGRQPELGQLDDYVFAGSPPPATLFVFGPGGVGKSTLLATSSSTEWSRRTCPLSTSISTGPPCGPTAR